METTDWFPPDIKPVYVGWYEAAIYDAGWIYEWRIWWDGSVWRDRPEGCLIPNQNQTWRGQMEQPT